MTYRSRSILHAVLGMVAFAGIAAGGYMLARNMPLVIEQANASAEAGPTQPGRVATGGETQLAQTAPKEVRDGMAANSTTTTTTTHGGWTVICNEGGEPPRRVCSANYRVINKQNNTNVLVWVVGFNAQGGLLSEFLTLTDVQIQPGVVVRLGDGAPLKADYVECTTKGCKARLEMTPELTGQLKAATKAVIEMTRLDGQVIQFQMEIPGIDRALADLGV